MKTRTVHVHTGYVQDFTFSSETTVTHLSEIQMHIISVEKYITGLKLLKSDKY